MGESNCFNVLFTSLLSSFRTVLFFMKNCQYFKFTCIHCNLPLRLPTLPATSPEFRDNLYNETTFQESLQWSLNTDLTVTCMNFLLKCLVTPDHQKKTYEYTDTSGEQRPSL